MISKSNIIYLGFSQIIRPLFFARTEIFIKLLQMELHTVPITPVFVADYYGSVNE